MECFNLIYAHLSLQYLDIRTLSVLNIPEPVIYTLAFPFDLRCESVTYIYICYNCNMGTSDLPDIYARRPRARSARGRVQIYQANHKGACYNCYVTRPHAIVLKFLMNTDCVVSDSLLWKGEEKFLSLADQRRFCLGIPGWCPCINCTEPEMATIDPSKPLGRKRKTTESKIHDTSNLEPVAKKVDEKVEDRFLFDVTTEELENFMEGECPKNTVKSNEWAIRNFEAWRNARNK